MSGRHDTRIARNRIDQMHAARINGGGVRAMLPSWAAPPPAIPATCLAYLSPQGCKMIKSARAAFSRLYDCYDVTGKVALSLGLMGMVASALMVWFFGAAISWTHGAFFVVVSLGAAIGPHLAHRVYSKSVAAGLIVGALFSPLFVIEFYSHMGYTAGLRGVNIGDAKVQQARYAVAYDGVDENKTNQALWRKQLAELEAAHAWAPTVAASGLRDSLPALDEAIRQETKRGGCGPKCLALTRDKAAVTERIAIAERRDDLTAKIEATNRVLSAAQDKATKTEFKHSAAAHQALSLVKAVSLVFDGSLTPSDLQSEAVEQSVNVGVAVAATGLPALFLFIAGFFMTGTGSSRERLDAFLDNVNKHGRHLGVPEFKAA